MSDEVFWVMIGSIGQCVGALATFAAVCVALWQTKYVNRKRIKLSFNNFVYAMFEEQVINAISVNIKNIGNKPITINQFGIEHDDGSSTLIMQENQGVFRRKMPLTIDTDNIDSLYFLSEAFSKHISEMIQEKRIEKKKKLKFVVIDSVGKKYRIKSNKAAEYYAKKFW